MFCLQESLLTFRFHRALSQTLNLLSRLQDELMAENLKLTSTILSGLFFPRMSFEELNIFLPTKLSWLVNFLSQFNALN